MYVLCIIVYVLYNSVLTTIPEVANTTASLGQYFFSILKRAAKLPMKNSQYFTSFPSNFFWWPYFLRTSFFPSNILPLPIFFRPLSAKSASPKNFSFSKIFFALKKRVKLDNSKMGCTSLSSGPHAALGSCVGHPWTIQSTLYGTLTTIQYTV